MPIYNSVPEFTARLVSYRSICKSPPSLPALIKFLCLSFTVFVIVVAVVYLFSRPYS